MKWERKILIGILRGKKFDKEFYIRKTNAETYSVYDESRINDVIKSRKVQWPNRNDGRLENS